jgi:hypothetical protein
MTRGSPADVAQWTPSATPEYEVSGAFSYTRAYGTNSGAFNLFGGSAEFTNHFHRWIAATADAGAYRFRGLPSGITSTMYTFAAGPRITFGKRICEFTSILIKFAALRTIRGIS